jgi:hypothetical protein
MRGGSRALRWNPPLIPPYQGGLDFGTRKVMVNLRQVQSVELERIRMHTIHQCLTRTQKKKPPLIRGVGGFQRWINAQ